LQYTVINKNNFLITLELPKMKQETIKRCAGYSLLTLLVACGGGGSSSSSSTPAAVTYGSTSTKGDYATWTISGSDLSAVWQEIDALGAVGSTINLTATCGAPEATYSFRTCTFVTITSTNPAATLPAIGSTFEILESPGNVIFVHTGSAGGGNEQVHSGLVKSATACAADLSGDYIYSHAGFDHRDLWGFYNTNSDFSSVTHADFGMSGASIAAATLQYRTGGGTGTGAGSITGTTCADGVRTVALDSGDTARLVKTDNGMFILDLPSGKGGIVAFKTSTAATLANLAGKRLGVVVFEENSVSKDTSLLDLTAGAVVTAGSDSTITLTGTKNDSASAINATIEPISNPGLAARYATPAGYTTFNGLAAATPNPRNQNGVFQITADSGANITVALTVGPTGKIMGFGNSSKLVGTDLRGKGSFYIFEK
jgi:hypothetical protein